jgi:hypothetical protein
MNRRRFLQSTATLAAPAFAGAQSSSPKVRVGMDHFAVRATGWKAPQYIDYDA